MCTATYPVCVVSKIDTPVSLQHRHVPICILNLALSVCRIVDRPPSFHNSSSPNCRPSPISPSLSHPQRVPALFGPGPNLYQFVRRAGLEVRRCNEEVRGLSALFVRSPPPNPSPRLTPFLFNSSGATGTRLRKLCGWAPTPSCRRSRIVAFAVVEVRDNRSLVGV